MEEAIRPSDIRGFINDLTRTLTASLVCLDDLLIGLNNNSEEYCNARLVNAQLERALEFFLKMRSEYLFYESDSNIKYTQDPLPSAKELSHNFNNKLARIILNYELAISHIDSDIIIKGVNIAIEALLIVNNFIASDTMDLGSINTIIKYSGNKTSLPAIKRLPSDERSRRINKNILLVEDQKELIDLIYDVLLERDYSVFHAENGREAISIFAEKHAQLEQSLIDVGLPDTNGIELGNYFLSQKPDLKILYTSGYDLDSLRRKYKVPDNFYFLKKPYRVITMVNQLENHLKANIYK